MRSLRDLGGQRGMPHMLKYLTEHPEKGLLGYETYGLTMNVQYWRSFEDLERFANDTGRPAPRGRGAPTGSGSAANPRTGIWHETYLVRAGEYEAVYGNMPPHGLGKAARLVPLNVDSSARGRLRRLDPLGTDYGTSGASCSSAARASASSRCASAIRSSRPGAPKRLTTVCTASTMAGSMMCSVMAPSKHDRAGPPPTGLSP